nr:MAG TPA: hypothetical protein [Caudoviricetes sp.]
MQPVYFYGRFILKGFGGEFVGGLQRVSGCQLSM